MAQIVAFVGVVDPVDPTSRVSQGCQRNCGSGRPLVGILADVCFFSLEQPPLRIKHSGLNPLSSAPWLFLFSLNVFCVHLPGAETLYYRQELVTEVKSVLKNDSSINNMPESKRIRHVKSVGNI